MKTLAIFFLLSGIAFGQAWSGVLDPSRAIDWSKSGLPSTFPDGETTPNPWTPPTRTQCVTTACNTVSGGSVTIASVNSAITSAPNGTYVLVPAGTYNLTGTINLKSNVTLRGSGAQATVFGTGVSFAFGSSGQGAYGSGSLLTGSITKGSNQVTILAGQTVPTAGKLVALAQCMDGFTAPNAGYTQYNGGWVSNCTGTISDPLGPWTCGGFAQCDRNGNRTGTNPHFPGQVFWLNSVSGNTLTLAGTINSPLWRTSNTASIVAMNPAGIVGAGIEDLTSQTFIGINGCYACWLKGNRIVFSDGNPGLAGLTSHNLFANNYFAGVGAVLHTISIASENDQTTYDSDSLYLNNIFWNCYIEENGVTGYIQAYNYFAGGTGGYSGDFPHNPGGQTFMLREGNQSVLSWDDDTWTGHNFSTWFRAYASGFEPISGTVFPDSFDVGGFSRFDNVIGSVVGSTQSNPTGSYTTVLGVNRDGVDTTGLTAASLMRWGNYVYCAGNAACNVSTGAFVNAEVPTNLSTWPNSVPYQNPLPANHNLPASFFINGMTVHPNGGTGLSWWKACASWTTFPTNCGTSTTPPMPPIGPDVTGGQNANGHAYNIPAQIAYTSLPADATIGNGVKQFDERVFQADPGGSSPIAQISPTSVTFTSQVINKTGAAQVITISNIGSASMTISAISANGDFSVQSQTCGVLPATLNASSSCTANVIFTPTIVGARSGTFSVTDNASGSPHTASLSGTGLAPTASVTSLFALAR